MLYTPRIFISHSAKEPEALELCKAVDAGLQAAGFQVLWDASLVTGESWRGAIDEWIWKCDAAVLVLSNSALDSRYVAYEAALLRQRWRHMQQPQFVLVPVWCPGVTEQVLVQSMGSLQIAEIHTNVKLAQWPAQGAAAPFDVEVQRILKELQDVHDRTQPRNEIEHLLIQNLDSGAADDGALAAIADAYGLDQLTPGAKKDRAVLLARLLLDFKDALGDPRFQRLRNGIPTMRAALQGSNVRVPQIVKLVAPYCWVSPNCVARIPAALLQPAGGFRAIAWSRKWSFSERMYLYRAFGTRSKLRIANASELSGGGAQALFDHVVVCLAEKVCYDANATVAAVKKVIKRIVDKGELVVLILSADSIDDALLTQICSTFPELSVFLYSGNMNEDQLRTQFPKVQIVEPALTEDDEADARTGWGDCIVAAGWNRQQVHNLEEFDS